MATDGILSVSIASVMEDVLQNHGNRLCDVDLASRKAEEAGWRRYEVATKIPNCFSSEEGECVGALETVNWAHQRNIDKVIFEGDMKGIELSMNGGSSNLHWRSSSILTEIKELCKDHNEWTFQTVSRQRNSAADSMANFALTL